MSVRVRVPTPLRRAVARAILGRRAGARRSGQDLADRLAGLHGAGAPFVDGNTERLLERQAIDAATLADMEQRVAAQIEHAATFASESPFPAPAELTTDVYA